MSVSIRQVAKAAGVSITTVSNVLNCKGSMSIETRQRVQEVIVDLGYRRKHQRSDKLAFISAVPNGFGHSCIFQAAAEDGLSINVVICSEELDAPPLFDVKKQIAGVVAYGGRWKSTFLSQLITSYPTVLMGSSFPSNNSDAVWVDNAGGIYSATDYLIRQGHRCIGLINGPENSVTSAEKRIGFIRALRNAGLLSNGIETGTANFSLASGREAALRLLSQTPRPSAIIAGESSFGLATLDVCRNLGLQVPKDLSLITFHDELRLQQGPVPLTAISIPELTICRTAIASLARRIGDPNTPGQRVLLQPTLIERKSVCAP